MILDKFFSIIFIISLACSFNVVAKKIMILDKLEEPGKTAQGNRWQFFTDGVMGGISSGKVNIKELSGKSCYHMIGNVTTENNGGFIQMRVKINSLSSSDNYTGVYLKVLGNNLVYSIHIRTPYTKLPWQYYSSTFTAKNSWKEVRLPFNEFIKSNFYQPKKFNYQKIKTLGIVAGFDDFKADICISEIGFY